MTLTPIALFVYNRPAHTRQTIESLLKNESAGASDLFIFSDAARSPESAGPVSEVRQYIRQIEGFKSVNIVERAENLGLARSIIDGASTIVNKAGRIIVLEDDMVTSPFFLRYMNQALDKYAGDDRVISIHGYVYPVSPPMPKAFFLPGADCWGWATWSRGWTYFNSDGSFLLNELTRRKLISAFDFNGTFPYSRMLEEQIKGTIDSWAIRWYASAFLADKLTLYPGRSLVHNIGNDNSGTHSEETSDLNVELSTTPIDLNDILVEPSEEGRLAFEAFFKQKKTGLLRKMAGRAIALLKGS